MAAKKVLIVGGYGTVGSQIAKILHDLHPEIEWLVGGRSSGKPLPFSSTRVKALYVDNTNADPLSDAPDDLSMIINSVNDPDDSLLLTAVKRQIPLLDITRWTEKLSTRSGPPLPFLSWSKAGSGNCLAKVRGKASCTIRVKELPTMS